MKVKIILSLSLLIISSLAIGQKLSTSSRKAQKLYEEASGHITYGHYFEANKKLQKAISVDNQFIEAYLLLGDLNTDLHENANAVRYYKKALAIDSSFYPQAHYFIAKILISEGEYLEAERYFNSFLSFINIDDYSKSDAQKNILNCQFALTALQNPVDFKPVNLGKNINSVYSEYFPTITVDDKVLLYTRRLGEEGKHQQEDFYISIKGKGNKWVAAQNMGNSINTPLNEGAASISADGKTIIFTACEQNGVYGYGRTGYGSCDLFFTRKRGNKWSKAVNLGPPINTSNWESQPSLSSDGETLYFVRGVSRGNRRESDIYVSSLDNDGYWSKPNKLPSTINTNEAEESVLIHPDNRTLYFSSRGKIGMGGSDIFISKKNMNNEWEEAVNLGYPINTFKDENSLLVSPNGEIGYFASDRNGGMGGLDLYSFKMPEEIKPDPVTYFKGVVYDSLSRKLLSAKIELIDIKQGETVYSSVSNSQSGQFFLTLNPQHNYMINVSKDGYLFYSDTFIIEKNYAQMKPFLKNIPLLPIRVGSSIVLKNIFFELDKSNLKTESQSELNKLFDFLVQNKSIVIEIAGHTDKQGSHEYNLKLSEDRAKAVYNFLISKGIDKNRMQYKGYAFDKPIDTNDTEAGRARNRRTEFIIISN